MPTYLFQCDPCGHQFDVQRPMDDRDQPAECPECCGDARRLFTACLFRMPTPDFAELTARDILGRDTGPNAEARSRVTVTVGAPKVRPRI